MLSNCAVNFVPKMAQIEPMDVDTIESEFEDKENCLHISNVLPRTPCTEKGYEELDVSELNMKLRYSVTPASSPMSRSYTANCTYNKSEHCEALNNTIINNESMLSRSLNSTLTKPDNVLKSPKLPLQSISTGQFVNGDKSSLVRRSLDNEGNVTVTINSYENDDNISLPSTSSSTVQTPEATTPTKEIPKSEGSPILRGLKSVLNMFRPSQSPIPTSEEISVQKDLSPIEMQSNKDQSNLILTLASTPIASNKKDNFSRRNSPLKESVTFNDDLERELQWKDETTIFFKEEKIPAHKLFVLQASSLNTNNEIPLEINKLNTTVEYMDVSEMDAKFNESLLKDRTMTDIDSKIKPIEVSGVESDGEFVDCETTYTKKESALLESFENSNKNMPVIIKTNNIAYESYVEADLKLLSVENMQESFKEINKEDIVIQTDNMIRNLSVDNSVKKVETSVQIPMTENPHSAVHVIHTKKDTNENESCNQIFMEVESKFSISKDSGVKLVSVEKSDNVLDGEDFDKLGESKEKPECHTVLQEDNQSHMNNSEQRLSSDETNQPIDYCNNVSSENNVLTLSHNVIAVIDIMDVSTENNINLEKYNEKQNISADSVTLSNAEAQIASHSDVYENKDLRISNFNVKNISDDIIHNNMYSNNQQNHDSDIILTEIVNSNDAPETKLVTKENVLLKEVELSPEDTLVAGSDAKGTFIPFQEIIIKTNTDNVSKTELVQINQNKFEHSADTTINVDSGKPDIFNMKLSNNNAEKYFELEAKNKIIPDYTDNSVEISDYEVNDDEKKCLKTSYSNEYNKGDENCKSSTEELVKENDNLTFCQEKDITYDKKDLVVNKTENTQSISNLQYTINNTYYIHDQAQTKSVNCTNNEFSTDIPADIPLPMDDIDENNAVNLSSIKNSNPDMFKMEASSGHQETSAEYSNITEYTENQLSLTNELQSNLNSDFNLNIVKTVTAQEILQDMLQRDLNNTKKGQAVMPIEALSHNKGINDNATEITADLPKQLRTDNQLKSNILDDEPCGDKNLKTKNCDEEIVTSANNSPYVSMTDINFSSTTSETVNPFEMNNELLVSPPIPLKCSKKEYNINFDEIDDPFATKTNIRMSPERETTFEYQRNHKNVNIQKKTLSQRKSQPETKKSYKAHKYINSSLDDSKASKSTDTKPLDKAHSTSQEGFDKNCINVNKTEKLEVITKSLLSDVKMETNDLKVSKEPVIETKKDIVTVINSTEDNSSGNMETKSVFNLPEIGDISFRNSFPETKIYESNSPVENFKYLSHPGKISGADPVISNILLEENIHAVENISPDKSNITCSLKNSDEKNVTVHEVHTEDEDTIEGPFFDDDFTDVGKISEFKTENDNMPLKKLPETGKENLENELFIDAEAFEFLLNQNKSNMVVDSGKESLFLKFDPLFAKRISSDSILSALNTIQKQSTPIKLTKTPLKKETNEEELKSGPSNFKNMSEEFNDEVGNFTLKPMMVVNPAVNPVVSTRKSITPPRVNRQSLTFTSPAMVVIDRLLSLSSNMSLLDENITLPETNRNHETDIALIQLRELLAEKEIQVFNLRCESKELKERLLTLEIQVKSLENESQERLRKVNDLNEHLAEKTKINKCMATVVEEYERTIASLISDLELDKKRNAEERMRLISERDEQTVHLASMEDSYNDLHSKYEKSKQIIFSMKANEDIYKKSLKEFDDNFLKMQNNYELLKQHATTKLNHANQELEKINRAHESEVVKLTTMLKRKELQITSLEETLAQKIKANEELTAICDELINKVG